MFQDAIEEHLALIRALEASCGPPVEELAAAIIERLGRGGKVMLCGNGGSAADAQHFAAELSGRFERDRRPLPAMALTCNSSALTAIGNDYGYEHVFERQVRAFAGADDVLVGISTSGNSGNVVEAVNAAREVGAYTAALTGGDGGKLRDLSDLCIRVPSTHTARIQEAHILICHVLCQIVEDALAEPESKP